MLEAGRWVEYMDTCQDDLVASFHNHSAALAVCIRDGT